MNLCTALREGKSKDRAIRRIEWPFNLAWYHGLDNQICWYNSDPDGYQCHKTGDIVSFAIADFWAEDFFTHPNFLYHGDMHLDIED